MKDGKIVLIAYHLLESSIGAYLEWLVNELMMIANKIEYKDTCLVMFFHRCNNPQAKSLHILEVFYFPPIG